MKQAKLNLLLVFLTVSLFSGSVLAKTVYVTDKFKITMRSGESSKHKIIRMLPTGTALKVININRDSGYTEVATRGGSTGYVLTRQLLNEPVAREQLMRANEQINKLQAAPGELKQSLSELMVQHNELQAAHNDLTNTYQKTNSELTRLKRISADAVKITQERDDFSQQVTALKEELVELNLKNTELQNNTTQRWFMIGAGAIVLGILLGLILPHVRFGKRQKDWGTL